MIHNIVEVRNLKDVLFRRQSWKRSLVLVLNLNPRRLNSLLEMRMKMTNWRKTTWRFRNTMISKFFFHTSAKPSHCWKWTIRFNCYFEGKNWGHWLEISIFIFWKHREFNSNPVLRNLRNPCFSELKSDVTVVSTLQPIQSVFFCNFKTINCRVSKFC